MTHLFLEYKTAQQRRTLIRRQRPKHPLEHHLRQQQLISTRNLTRHTALHLDHIVLRCKAQSAQYAFTRFELFELQHIVDGCDFPLERFDVFDGALFVVVCGV